MKRPLSDYRKLAISIVIPLVVGWVGSIPVRSSVSTWYAELEKPAFNPPNAVFGPVWTVLYLLMGISLFIVWRSSAAGRHSRSGVGLFAVQLVLNALWSFAFFGMRSPGAGAIVIIALWIMIAATLLAFLRVSRFAGALLVPYMGWVSFAAVLNLSIYLLNR